VPPGGGKNKETEEMITMLVRLVKSLIMFWREEDARNKTGLCDSIVCWMQKNYIES